MRILVLAAPALLLAGLAVAQDANRPNPLDPRTKVPPVEYRSAFEGYRSFSDTELRDWRKANEEVGAAAGHGGHRPGHGPGTPTSKPEPGEPESRGGAQEKGGAPSGHEGHGGHK